MPSRTAWCPQTFLNTYLFAARAHQGQTVPTTERLPYIFHVSTVAMEVCAALTVEAFPNPDMAVQCALLHDTVEDTAVTAEQLIEEFGAKVSEGVLALTKDKALPKPEAMADSLRRIRLCPPEVWIVKLADRITNLQTPPSHWSSEKRAYYVGEARLIADELGEASPYLKARIDGKIEKYQRVYCTGA